MSFERELRSQDVTISLHLLQGCISVDVGGGEGCAPVMNPNLFFAESAISTDLFHP